MRRPLAVLAIAATLAAPPAQAALLTYGAVESFNAATGPNTLVDFSGSFFIDLIPGGDYWYTTNPGGFSLGGATFTVGSGGSYQAIVAPAYYPDYYERGTGNVLHADLGRDLIISFAAPVDSFALTLSSIVGRTGLTTLTFSNGDTASAALGDPWAFHGYIASTPFSSVTIAGVSGDYLLVDNIRFADIEESATPEPASLALLALGLAALTTRRRKT